MRNAYASLDVQTASPVVLVARLYTAALRHARRAREASTTARMRGEALDRVLAIVGELRQSLCVEQGGEIARNLESLYLWMGERLLDANRGEVGACDEVIGVLERLDEAWQELARRPADALAREVEALEQSGAAGGAPPPGGAAVPPDGAVPEAPAPASRAPAAGAR